MTARVVLVLVLLVGVIAWSLTRDVHDEAAPAVRASPAAEPASERPQLPSPPKASPEVMPQAETPVPQPVAAAAPGTGLVVHVTDEHGAPLQGVGTSAYRPVDQQLFKATTDADGSAWLDCAAGSYVVCAEDERPETVYAPICREAVDVAPQGSTQFTLVLFLADARVEAFVRDDTGQPIAGVEINGSGYAPRSVLGNRLTDEKGRAVWEPVVAGSWWLRVQSVDPGSGIVPPDDVQAEVFVDPGRSAWHEFVLSRQGTIVVRMADVPHAEQLKQLTLYTENGSSSQYLKTSDESEIRAAVFTWRVEPGEHVLAAEWTPDGPCWSRPQTVRVEAGKTTYPVVEPLQTQVRLSGHVHDRFGVPVAGVGVRVVVRTAWSNDDWKQSRLEVLAEKTVSSADDGNWYLELPLGLSMYEVNAPLARGRHLARFEGVGEITDFSRPLEITVNAGCIVSGRVEGVWATRAAEGDLNVYIAHEQAPDRWAGQRTANLNADGTFELKHVGAGTYTAVLRRSGQVLTDTLRFEVPSDFEEGATLPVTLAFPESPP